MNLHRRLPAGAAALIFFAMFFALPLYAAATMCSMPCCHAAAGATMKSNLLACPGSECVITSDDATVKAVSRYVAPSLTAIAHVSAPVVAVSADTQTFAAVSPPPSSPPLNVLHSVFRI
jgi:hypothetical protein